MTATAKVTTTAEVLTERPARYGKQLAAHLGRNSGSEWDESAGAGWINLAGGRVELTATAVSLDICLTTAPESLDKLEEVVGRHLVRFATREELAVRWGRGDGTPGTRQGHTG